MAALVALVYLALPLRVPVERPLVYWSIDEHTLGVLVGDYPNLGCGVAWVDESSDAVRIHAECFEHLIPGPQAAMLQPYVMQVSLADPLGTRAVYDGMGNPGRSCPGPWQQAGCNIPG